MRMKTAALLAVMATMMAGSAHALTDTTNMNVSMTVYTPTTCTVSAGGIMDFGTYVTNNSSNYTATTPVNVTCTSNRSYNLYPDPGLNYSGNRRMKDTGTNYLGYYLYQDASHTSLWESSNRYYGTGTGASQTFTVYGYLWSGQLTTAGTADGYYNDTVTMYVEYSP